MDLGPGMVIAQNVSLVRLLGEGGMGSVWVADHLTLQTQVAVKFIAASLAQQAKALERFTREATSAARIKSPHVVQILDHGVFDGLPYIVMELLDGEDLARRLERCGRLGLAETAEILQQTAKALSDAHGLGIVHRDIKPANIFLTQSAGEVFVKLLDFGVAKRDDPAAPRMTATGATLGTPSYMSPEQVFSGGVVDHRTDLWSLSVVAYECVTGRLPFDGATIGDINVAIHAAEFTAPSALCEGLTPDIDAWFHRALQRDPARRFGSPRELASAFMAAAQSAAASTAMPPSAATTGSNVAMGAAEPVTHHAQTFAGTASPRPASSAGRRGFFVAGVLGAAVSGGVAIAVIGGSSSSTTPTAADTATAPEPATAPEQPTRAEPAPLPPPDASSPTVQPAPSSEPTAQPAPSSTPASTPAQPPRAAQAPPVTAQPTRTTTAAAPTPAPTSTRKKRDHGF